MNDLFRIPLDFPDTPALNDEFHRLERRDLSLGRHGLDADRRAGAGVYLPLAGGTMEGPLVLDANPVIAMDAATKLYVDTIATGARHDHRRHRRDERTLRLFGRDRPAAGPLVDAGDGAIGLGHDLRRRRHDPPDPLLPPEVWNMTMRSATCWCRTARTGFWCTSRVDDYRRLRSRSSRRVRRRQRARRRSSRRRSRTCRPAGRWARCWRSRRRRLRHRVDRSRLTRSG